MSTVSQVSDINLTKLSVLKLTEIVSQYTVESSRDICGDSKKKKKKSPSTMN